MFWQRVASLVKFYTNQKFFCQARKSLSPSLALQCYVAVFPVKSRKIKEMTRGDKGKLFTLFVPLFTLPTQQDCELPVGEPNTP